MTSNWRAAAVEWVASELTAMELYEEADVQAAKEAMTHVLKTVNTPRKVKSSALVGRLKGRCSDAETVAEASTNALEPFQILQEMEEGNFFENAKLSKELLQEHGLDDYIEAAENGKKAAMPYLDFLRLQQEHKDLTRPNLYVCILASAGTGKTQLAATASLTYEYATTIYLNMGRGETQRFYSPHISDGCEMLKESVQEFLQQKHENVTATDLFNLSKSRADDGTFLFVRILYHLLTGEPFIAANCSSRMALKELKEKIKGKKYLVFIDEVPPPMGTKDFLVVLCLRDILRFLGIAPMLMSTHTGAQDCVGMTSRKSFSKWTWILSSLPKYTHWPLANSNKLGLTDTERPLVLGTTRKEGYDSLPRAVEGIRTLLQGQKSEAWLHSPMLQLVQLFSTDVVLNGNSFTASHSLVGHHFGCLLQSTEAGKESYNCVEADLFKANISVSPVCASAEPLLYLALVTWHENMLRDDDESYFPLVDSNGKALTVREAFQRCDSSFVPKASAENIHDGNLLEVLVHAALTLASMRTAGQDNGNFLPGMTLANFITLVRRLMLPGTLEELPKTPPILDKETPKGPKGGVVVPALGGSNSGLPAELAKVLGSNLGFLARPPDKSKNDGEIMDVVRDGKSSDQKPFMQVECKNYREGVSSTILQEIFLRINRGIQCSLVFVSSLTQGFDKSDLSQVKRNCFQGRFKLGEVAVLLWKQGQDAPAYLKVGGKPWKPSSKKTQLLVVVIEVGAVGAAIQRGQKRKSPPCANRELTF